MVVLMLTLQADYGWGWEDLYQYDLGKEDLGVDDLSEAEGESSTPVRLIRKAKIQT